MVDDLLLSYFFFGATGDDPKLINDPQMSIYRRNHKASNPGSFEPWRVEDKENGLHTSKTVLA